MARAPAGGRPIVSRTDRKTVLIRVLLVVGVAAAFIALEQLVGLGEYFSRERIRQWLAETGPWAPAAFAAAMAAAIVVSPIPSAPLAFAGGLFFGPTLGTLYSVVGATVGAGAAFLIARGLGRAAIQRILRRPVIFCPDCPDGLLARVVFVARLIPLVSFDLVSYGAGLTRMRFAPFVIVTALGMAPMTLLYNIFGASMVVGKVAGIVISAVFVCLVLLLPFVARRYDIPWLSQILGRRV